MKFLQSLLTSIVPSPAVLLLATRTFVTTMAERVVETYPDSTLTSPTAMGRLERAAWPRPISGEVDWSTTVCTSC